MNKTVLFFQLGFSDDARSLKQKSHGHLMKSARTWGGPLSQFYGGWGQQRTEKEARSLHSSRTTGVTAPGDGWVTEV